MTQANPNESVPLLRAFGLPDKGVRELTPQYVNLIDKQAAHTVRATFEGRHPPQKEVKMHRRALWILFLIAVAVFPVRAQDFNGWNFNLGVGPNFPLGKTADVAGTSGQFMIGGGPNFSERFGMNLEFGWYRLPIKGSALTQVSAASADVSQLSLTPNVIVRFPLSPRWGAYAIGGGGWYMRSASATVTGPALVPGVACSPFFIIWGVNCVSGLVPANASLVSTTSHAFGGNIGGGFTVRPGEGSMKVYVEVRYHYAPHEGVATTVLPLTVGIRW